jgi:hypothetical protein
MDDNPLVRVVLVFVWAVIFLFLATTLASCGDNRVDEVVESPQFRTVDPSRLGNDAPVMAHLTPSNAPSQGVGHSAPINSSISAETRSERIRNRLVFQQVLSLPSYKKREKRKKKQISKEAKTKKKKKSKKAKTKRDDAQDGFEVIHQQSASDRIEEVSSSALDTTSENEDMTRKGSKKRSTKNKNFVQDIEMGDENNEDEDENESCRIHRGHNGNFASTLRSIRRSIQLFVFFNHDSKGIDEEDILQSKKAMKDQLACSICLEEYIVGDVVVRLKENNSGDNTRDDSGAHSCKHCFHEDCILEWLRTHDECPLCRFNMLTDTS